VDHGPGYILRDADGKDALIKLVDSIEPRQETVTASDGTASIHHFTLVRFITPDGQPPGSMPENCVVEFSEVEGMYGMSDATRAAFGASLNDSGTWPILPAKSSDPKNSLRIGDTRGFSPYTGGGVITEVKEPRPVPFRSLAQSTLFPSTTECGVVSAPGDQGLIMINMMSQFCAGGIEQQLHIGLQGILAFHSKHGHLPEANNAAQEDVRKLSRPLVPPPIPSPPPPPPPVSDPLVAFHDCPALYCRLAFYCCLAFHYRLAFYSCLAFHYRLALHQCPSFIPVWLSIRCPPCGIRGH